MLQVHDLGDYVLHAGRIPRLITTVEEARVVEPVMSTCYICGESWQVVQQANNEPHRCRGSAVAGAESVKWSDAWWAVPGRDAEPSAC